jgi:dolichyl-phosphate-mannose-protein mannosyltransferase
LTETHIDKRNLLTVAVLSIVFFSVATWNLGMTQTPLTTWKTTENKSFYVDIGGFKNTGNVYFLVKSGNATVEVYTGSPGNWSYSTTVTIEGYYSWSQLYINKDTQYVRFDFQPQPSSFPPPPFIEIAEMAILSQDNERIAVNTIATEGAPDKDLLKLIDEQSLVQCPPTYMSETFFDEIYYVRTAENYLKLQQPYEWTHPPLGKFIIASGILVFGYNPFGWRIMGVVFATLMITLIYILGKELFGTWIGAFASAFLLTFDFMVFTMGRMATVDTYVVFFSLASQLFFLIYVKNVLKNGWKTSVLPLLLAVLFFALGFSTKWLVLYGFLGQLAILLALRLKEVIKLKDGLSAKISAFFNRPFFQLYFFLLLAILVYFLTYIPDMLAGRSLVDVLQLQGSMYIYHSTLNATHPFASSWWTWPLMLRPLWLYASYLPANIVSTIVLMGNPAVWWVGFAFLILAVEEAVRSKDFACIFITVLFFFQWLPYVFISRITFIYHFYVNVPFLCLATAYFLNKYWSRKWGKATALAYFAGVVVLFWLFYPAISGTPTPTSSIDSLKWLGSWVF